MLYLLLLVFLFVLVQIGIVSYAFGALGISTESALLLLFACLVGSAVNIPVRRVSADHGVVSPRRVQFMGWRFQIPSRLEPQKTLIAVNLGGAVIPTGVSVYLLLSTPALVLPAAAATVILSLVVYGLARPIEGVGIGVPLFLPPVVAALLALLLGSTHAPQIAYVAGTLGTLIGADLMNLRTIANSGAPVASIGGAGTFDGIFLTGVIAVLLASL